MLKKHRFDDEVHVVADKGRPWRLGELEIAALDRRRRVKAERVGVAHRIEAPAGECRVERDGSGDVFDRQSPVILPRTGAGTRIDVDVKLAVGKVFASKTVVSASSPASLDSAYRCRHVDGDRHGALFRLGKIEIERSRQVIEAPVIIG